ncbi:DNA-processing protein DprA [Sphingomonas ursincola]|uniref:DNA-protecting protein DprA n=1 Tax=Sphingomonas ursincola TaxID=56361 RepID=A0A7V8RFV2_9SPHN|nr:DNA-processing protein DprA [Sphingomonas ursincola]MBA1375673.1 DNA-protecting protein DprA [Sphingomonas ursincola]
MLSAEHLARIRLLRSERIGPISFAQLMRRFGSALAAIEALPDLVQRTGGRALRIATLAQAEQEARRVEAAGARYLFADDADYPELLAHIDNAPPILTVRGDTRLMQRPSIATVGARNASASACRFARQIAGELAEAGFLVVSGLARGIDTSAHEGALRIAGTGAASTAGVIASGIDISYPPENRNLQAEMGERALVIAEQPPGTEPLARHFPYRNRIIAGMATGTLVVEAAPKSGSLITARLAAEAGRDVMAIPGSPLDSRSRGCNELIRGGATLVQGADDIMELVSPMTGARPRHVATPIQNYAAQPQPEPDDAARRTLVDLLGRSPIGIDELVRQSGLDSGAVQMILLDLELGGLIERHAAGRVSLV